MTIGIGTEGINQVLAWLVEVATTIGNTRDVWNNQTIAPVQVTILGTIVHGVLHCPDALLAILILWLRAEVVMEVTFQAETTSSVDRRVAIFDNLVEIILVDACHLILCWIILTISLVEIQLGQEGSCGSLGRTTLVALCNREYIIGSLHIVDNLLPSFIIRELRVGEIVVLLLTKVGIHDERNILVKTLQEEVSIATEELHLAKALCLQLVAVVCLLKQGDG